MEWVKIDRTEATERSWINTEKFKVDDNDDEIRDSD
jgi:hypothetical protein